MSRKDRKRREWEITRTLNHPVRLRILELHQRMRGQLVSVETLTSALAQTPEYGHVKAAEVKYHRDRLLDAELLSA